MALLWVDNASINRQTMTTIRSHAAKGRNLGKGRPRKQKSTRSATTSDDMVLVPRALQQLLPTSFELSSRSRVLLQRWLNVLTISFYPCPLDGLVRFDMTNSMWIKFMFTDEAYFHCTIALLNVAFGSTSVDRDSYAESLQHLAQTFSLVTKNLSGPTALTDTSFATVVSITQYHRIKHDHGAGLVHLDGLERMVAMSGGIERLAMTRPALTQKILRADLDFSMHLGVKPRFGHVRDLAEPLDACLNAILDDDILYTSIVAAEVLGHCPEDIISPLKMAFKLAAMINKHVAAGDPIDGHTIHALAVLLGYRLADIESFTQLPTRRGLGDTILVGLFAFLSTFLPDLTRRRQPMPYLSKVARLVLHQQCDVRHHARIVHTWALVLCCAFMLAKEDDVWAAPMLFEAMHQIGYSQLCSSLARMPWIGLLHDPLLIRILPPSTTDGAIPHSAKAFSALE